ncbi:MAG: helix-turn-helix domain-containing protein [Blastochloris sp.]|nr:helix-turn-helix domain-containing protein [Blastochloris sp.]
MRSLRETREAARRLRREEGLSINEIALKLNVAKSSVSYWVRDIELTPAQADVLRGKRVNNAGRIKGSRKNYENARALRFTRSGGRSRKSP